MKIIITLIWLSLSSFSFSEQYQSPPNLEMIEYVLDNKCDKFYFPDYDLYEMATASQYSEQCLNNYYQKRIIKDNYEQTFRLISISLLDDHIDLSINVFRNSFTIFSEEEVLTFLNNACLITEKYKDFMEVFLIHFPYHSETVKKLPFCEVTISNELKK